MALAWKYCSPTCLANLNNYADLVEVLREKSRQLAIDNPIVDLGSRRVVSLEILLEPEPFLADLGNLNRLGEIRGTIGMTQVVQRLVHKRQADG